MSDVKEAVDEMASPASRSTPVRYTTGLDLLDLVVGGGEGMGFPGGYIVNFVGDKSAGKTALAIETLVANKVKFGKAFHPNHDDAESGCTFDTQRMYGVELYGDKPPRKSKTVEEMDANIGLWLEELGKKGLGIYVVDSLDGLSDEDKEERAEARKELMEKGKTVKDPGTYGAGAPKFLSQEFFKTKAAAVQDANALLIIVSQVRENLNAGMFGKKLKRSGGKALDFYSHTCLWLSTVRKIVRKVGDESRVVGVVVEARTEKSKTPRPYRSCRFTFYFDYGLDNIGTSLDYLFDLRGEDGDLTKDAQAVAWKGRAAGLPELLEWLRKENLYEIAKAEKKEATGRAQLTMDWIGEWIRADADRKAKYEAEFGVSMTRDALIQLIESDEAMQRELKERVITKWEATERAVASNRRPKYG